MTNTMDFVNRQFIDDIMANQVFDGGDNGNENYDTNTIPDATLAYLRYLVQPYFDAIKDADSVESIRLWIHKFGEGHPLYKIFGRWNPDNKRTVDSLVQEIIKELLLHILSSAYISTGHDSERIYTPWDIVRGLEWSYGDDPDILENLAILFNIPNPGIYDILPTVPITVAIDNNTFIHEMSYQLVLGIIAFYQLMGTPHPLSVFGYDIPDYRNDLENLKRTDWMPYTHRVNVGPDTYYFKGKEFFRGLLTAAEWLNVDSHTYITDLVEYQHHPIPQNMGLPNIGDTVYQAPPPKEISLEYN